MIQNDVPVSDEAFDIMRFLSGYGFWLLIAILLIVVVFIKKSRK